MKRTTLFTVVLFLLAGCSLDINHNPNKPEEVTPRLLFPAIENAVATAIGGEIFNYAGFFCQYYDQLPLSNQYNALVEYNIQEQDKLIDHAYATFYSDALMDVEKMKELSSNPADLFATSVLRVQCLLVMADNTGEAPYKEACKGERYPMPHWDKGEDVYKGLLVELDSAESLVGQSEMECPDLLLNKDMEQWRGYANALRLRMYLRFVDAGKETEHYTEKIKELVSGNRFFKGNIKLDVYKDDQGKMNPFYTLRSILRTENHCGSLPLVSYQKKTSDPRIAYGFKKAEKTNTFEGLIPGSKRPLQNIVSYTDVSKLIYKPTQPVFFFTQAELLFLKAEVCLRFLSDEPTAKSCYEAAIKEDFDTREIEGAENFLKGANVAWEKAGGIKEKLERIYMQKWVALFYMDHMEAWSEIRRTDVPAISTMQAQEIYKNPATYRAGDRIVPWNNMLGGTRMVVRVPYPQKARQLNSNTPTAKPLDHPLWWDVK